MKTYMAKPAEALAARRWFVIDAEGIPVGRLSSTVAYILRGKHKPTYTPHVDTGDHVIVVNATKIGITGAKLMGKRHFWHTKWPGGLHSITWKRELSRHPDRIVRRAVKGMLPRGVLGRDMLRKLRVYGGAEHPHEAQQPMVLDFNSSKFMAPAGE